MVDRFKKVLQPYEVQYGLLAHGNLLKHYSLSEPIMVHDADGRTYRLHIHSARGRIDGLTSWHSRFGTRIGDEVEFIIDEDKSVRIELLKGGHRDVDRERIRNLLEQRGEVVLDDLFATPLTYQSVFRELVAINDQLVHLPQVRVTEIIERTVRNDTKIVALLKELSSYQCQFPGCNAKILKKDGSNYVEVAHITPVADGGRSVIGNLLVLCPNHHKEFDLGDLQIHEQTVTQINGQLNNRAFEIDLLPAAPRPAT